MGLILEVGTAPPPSEGGGSGTATASDIQIVRNWVGNDEPTDDAINTEILTWGSALLAAYNILKRRLADILNSPNFSVIGYSESWGPQITALGKQIEELAALTGQASGSADSTIASFEISRPEIAWPRRR